MSIGRFFVAAFVFCVASTVLASDAPKSPPFSFLHCLSRCDDSGGDVHALSGLDLRRSLYLVPSGTPHTSSSQSYQSSSEPSDGDMSSADDDVEGPCPSFDRDPASAPCDLLPQNARCSLSEGDSANDSDFDAVIAELGAAANYVGCSFFKYDNAAIKILGLSHFPVSFYIKLIRALGHRGKGTHLMRDLVCAFEREIGGEHLRPYFGALSYLWMRRGRADIPVFEYILAEADPEAIRFLIDHGLDVMAILRDGKPFLEQYFESFTCREALIYLRSSCASELGGCASLVEMKIAEDSLIEKMLLLLLTVCSPVSQQHFLNDMAKWMTSPAHTTRSLEIACQWAGVATDAITGDTRWFFHYCFQQACLKLAAALVEKSDGILWFPYNKKDS